MEMQTSGACLHCRSGGQLAGQQWGLSPVRANCPLASFHHPAISEGTRSTKSGRVMRAEDGGEEFGGSLAHAQMNFRFPRSFIPAPICLAGVVLSSISCDRKMSAGVREKKSGGK